MLCRFRRGEVSIQNSCQSIARPARLRRVGLACTVALTWAVRPRLRECLLVAEAVEREGLLQVRQHQLPVRFPAPEARPVLPLVRLRPDQFPELAAVRLALDLARRQRVRR